MLNAIHSKTVCVFKNKRFLTISLYDTSEHLGARHDCHFKKQKSIAICQSAGLLYMTKAHTYLLPDTDGEICHVVRHLVCENYLIPKSERRYRHHLPQDCSLNGFKGIRRAPEEKRCIIGGRLKSDWYSTAGVVN